jgi:hypothetical protein
MQVSMYIPNKTDPATWVSQASRVSVLRGNATDLNSQQQARGYGLRGAYFLACVEVYGFKDSKAILILNDDGVERIGTVKDRLLAKGGSNRFAVLDASVSNCYLIAHCTVRVLERIEDAKRNRRGVKWVILSAGFMDLRNIGPANRRRSNRVGSTISQPGIRLV